MVDKITTLPCAEEAEDHIVPSMTSQPDHSSLQVDDPRERAGPCPGATFPAAGGDQGTPTGPKAEAPPIALPPDVLAGHPEETEGPSPTSITRMVLS